MSSFTAPPRIVVTPESYTVGRGANVSFTCAVYAELLVNISWGRKSDDIFLDNSTNFRVTVYEQQVTHEGLNVIQSNLEICRVEKEDESEYVCVATNEFGCDNATFGVTVKGKFYSDTK